MLLTLSDDEILDSGILKGSLNNQFILVEMMISAIRIRRGKSRK